MEPSDQLPFSGAPRRSDDAAPSETSDDAARPAAEALDPSDATAAAVDLPEPIEVADEAPKVPASFQAAAGIQGRQFAEQCDTLLGHLGFTLHGRRVLTEVGVEIDQEAVSPGGTTVWFEYKGSVQGNRPGLRRTDTLKKAIANGALLRAVADPAPYVVVTSHLPEAGSGAAMLDAALRLRYLSDVVCLYDPKATARLRQW